jgi:hypothetical protein
MEIKDDTTLRNRKQVDISWQLNQHSFEVASPDFSMLFRQAQPIYEAMTNMLDAHDHGVGKAKYQDVSPAARNWIVDR